MTAHLSRIGSIVLSLALAGCATLSRGRTPAETGTVDLATLGLVPPFHVEGP